MSKPLETDSRISEEGANRSKETGEFENKELTACKELENFRTNSKLLEEARANAARTRLENFERD